MLIVVPTIIDFLFKSLKYTPPRFFVKGFFEEFLVNFCLRFFNKKNYANIVFVDNF